MRMNERGILLAVVGVLLSGCGGGSGGGGSGWPTRWKDTAGNDNFIPDLGETEVVTLEFGGDAKEAHVYYSATDLDLVFVTTTGTAPQAYAGRISTGRLDAYCNPGDLVTPAATEGLSALVSFMGDDLVIFGADGERFVCGIGTTKSRAKATYFSSEPVHPFIVGADDGFWFLKRAIPAQIVHLRYDGTEEMFPAPAEYNFLVDKSGGAYYFLVTATGEVTKFDVHTKAATVVGTMFKAGAPKAATADGFFASVSGPAVPGGFELVQYVSFAQGTMPKETPLPGHAWAGSVINPSTAKMFFVDGGAGVVINGRRYDTATGAEMKANVTNAIVGGQLAMSYSIGLLPTGHFYLLTGDYQKIGVAVRPTASNDITLDAAAPDFQLAGPPKAPPTPIAAQPTVQAFADGTCLVATKALTPYVNINSDMGKTIPMTEWGAGVAATRCGNMTTGKMLMLGAPQVDQLTASDGFGAPIPLDKPFLSAMHKRSRDMDCATCNEEGYEARTYQLFVSGWTVTAEGAAKPLFAHANYAWLRSHSLANLVVRHEDKLVVVAGDGS
jgi:hypothetical protein